MRRPFSPASAGRKPSGLITGSYVNCDEADRRPRVAEDDEAVRPDGGQDHARRDRTHRDLGETRRAGPVPRQGGLAVIEHDAAELAPAAGERAVTRRTAVRAAAPRGLGCYAGRPGPRGAWSAGCPTDRAGGTDRVCTEGGARDAGAGCGLELDSVRHSAHGPRPARREELWRSPTSSCHGCRSATTWGRHGSPPPIGRIVTRSSCTRWCLASG